MCRFLVNPILHCNVQAFLLAAAYAAPYDDSNIYEYWANSAALMRDPYYYAAMDIPEPSSRTIRPLTNGPAEVLGDPLSDSA